MRLNIVTCIVMAMCIGAYIWANNDDQASMPLLVFTLGALGAVIREQISALAMIDAKPYAKPELVYASPIVGGLLALVLLMLLVSGLLGGSFFPQFKDNDFNEESTTTLKNALRYSVEFASARDIFKLMAWSIVVGYSEKIVVSRLDQLAKRDKATTNKNT